MLSARTQRKLSGYGYINVGLPPASPSEREIMAPVGESFLARPISAFLLS